LMRYGRSHPLAQNFKEAYRTYPIPADPDHYDQFRKDLLTNRAVIEAKWTALASVRAWWTELNAFERIGDLTPARPDAELVSFKPIRAVTEDACAVAGLQAIDGQGDAAFATLLPIFEVGRKLEPSSRTLVRAMMARVLQNVALQTAAFVLDTTTVSPAARARFAAALAGGTGGETEARRLIAIEYAFSSSEANLDSSLFLGEQSIWSHRTLDLISPFLYNPRRTINLYGDLMADQQELAAFREVDKLVLRKNQFLKEMNRPRFKNIMGPVQLSMRVPSYDKVVYFYWRNEDLRSALAVRLAKP
jgi:hypothetical protein